jgi:hypothetical protein
LELSKDFQEPFSLIGDLSVWDKASYCDKTAEWPFPQHQSPPSYPSALESACQSCQTCSIAGRKELAWAHPRLTLHLLGVYRCQNGDWHWWQPAKWQCVDTGNNYSLGPDGGAWCTIYRYGGCNTNNIKWGLRSLEMLTL